MAVCAALVCVMGAALLWMVAAYLARQAEQRIQADMRMDVAGRAPIDWQCQRCGLLKSTVLANRPMGVTANSLGCKAGVNEACPMVPIWALVTTEAEDRAARSAATAYGGRACCDPEAVEPCKHWR